VKKRIHYGRDGVGQKTGVMCPTKCGNEIVYNGNYYCDNFENCGWAMGEVAENNPLLVRCLRGLESNRRGEYRKDNETSTNAT
jgi:hypothetical protein